MENNPNQGSIFNIGDLAKPVDTLIQRTSDFIGAALAPRQLIRMAKAKVDSDRIEKLGNVETEMCERALQRLLAEEVRNQENIENIVRLALPEVKKDAKPEAISDDWLSLFFNKSKQFSDDEMQKLWAKILAGEANKSGSFSRRAIELVSTLDTFDAQTFTDLCSYALHVKGKLTPLIFVLRQIHTKSPQIEVYRQKNITFETLQHLASIGLIIYQSNDYFMHREVNKFEQADYFGELLSIKFSADEDNSLVIGNVKFTKSGAELASVCNPEKNDAFLEFIIKKWTDFGYRISNPFEVKTLKL